MITAIVAFSDLTLFVGRQEEHPARKKYGGWWRWALVTSPDGVAPIRMVGVSASVNLPLHHKVQKFSSGTSSPGWSRKKGHKTVVVVIRASVSGWVFRHLWVSIPRRHWKRYSGVLSHHQELSIDICPQNLPYILVNTILQILWALWLSHPARLSTVFARIYPHTCITLTHLYPTQNWVFSKIKVVYPAPWRQYRWPVFLLPPLPRTTRETSVVWMFRKPVPLNLEVLFQHRWRKRFEGNQLTQVHMENDDENEGCGGARYEDWLWLHCVVVECPSCQYLDSLVTNSHLLRYTSSEIGEDELGPCLIVHLTPAAVMASDAYQSWMSRSVASSCL